MRGLVKDAEERGRTARGLGLGLGRLSGWCFSYMDRRSCSLLAGEDLGLARERPRAGRWKNVVEGDGPGPVVSQVQQLHVGVACWLGKILGWPVRGPA